jgi:16S rRNA (guanine(966)-N(2))-methyltransferase RsmD
MDMVHHYYRMTQKQSSPTRNALAKVRIIGGQWKRTPLRVVPAAGLRPTPNRVRETLFNWLKQDLSGWHVLDLCAGTGALGLEAASRNAGHVLMLESHALAAREIERIIAKLGASAQCRVEQTDAMRVLPTLPQAHYDLAFLDPPFDAGLHLPLAKACHAVLKPGGWLYVEAPSSEAITAVQALGYRAYRQSQAGAVSFALLCKDQSENTTYARPA